MNLKPPETRVSTVRRLSTAVFVASAGLILLAGSAAAHGDEHESDGHDAGTVDVVEVNGLLDPVLTEMMAETLRVSIRQRWSPLSSRSTATGQ